MSECPDVRALEDSELSSAIRAHVAGCAACRAVVELVDARHRAVPRDCSEFEDLLALRIDAKLDAAEAKRLDHHLETCEQCRAIAGGAMTISDIRAVRSARGDVSALREVDPDAYVLGPEVARGGMGRILEARDMRVGRSVAVKELLGASPDHAMRFEREARVTARLQHPGIVPIYEIGKWPDGAPFYSMRMVQGQTLRAALLEATTLQDRLKLLPSLIAAAEAVAYAHAHQIIHRDLTPANIMIGAYGDTVVIDWGLAKDLADTGEIDPVEHPYRGDGAPSDLTFAGAIIGTAAYMPPEQAMGGSVDERADVYALGAILYHLLAGRSPYKGSASVDILELVKVGPPTPVERVASDAPRDLLSIVGKAMARSAGDRYANAGELAAELVRFRDGHMVSAHRYSRADLVRRWISRYRTVFIGTTAALTALLVTGAIAIAGIVRERDRANAERAEAVAQRARAEDHRSREHDVTVVLLEEQGRQELLRGQSARALAFLDAALQQGLDTPALRMMIALALRNTEAEQRTYPCEGRARSVELSPDATKLVAACGAIVRIWNRSDGRTLASVPAQGARDAHFSHDGRSLLILGEPSLIADATTGAVLHRVGSASRFGFFAGDDREVSVVEVAGKVGVWNVGDGSLVRSLTVPVPVGEDVVSAAASADREVLVVTSLGGNSESWNPRTGTRLAAFDHGAQVAHTRVSSDGAIAVTCGNDAIAKLWSPKTGRPIRAFESHRGLIRACALSSDGKRVALGGFDGTAELWDVGTGRTIASLVGDAGSWDAVFSADGSRLAMGTGPGEVRVWAADSGVEIARFSAAMTSPALSFSADGLLFAADGSRVIAWDARGARRVSFIPPAGEMVVDSNAEGTMVVTQRGDGTFALWNAVTGRRVEHETLRATPFIKLDSPLLSLLSDDGTRLVAPTGNGHVAVVDVATGRTIARTAARREPSQITVDSRGTRVLIVGDGPPRIWDVDRDVLIATLDGYTGAGALDATGRRLLAWRDPHDIEVWDLDGPQIQATIHVAAGVTPIGFDESGTRVLVQESPGDFGAGLFVLFDAITGARMRSLAGTSAIFDESRRLVCAFGSGRAEVWRASDGARLTSAQIRPPGVDNMAPGPVVTTDGLFLASMDEGVTAMIVMSAADGRILAKVDRTLTWTELLPGGGLFNTGVDSHWIPGTHSLVAMLGHSAIWDFDLEQRTPAEIHRIVDANVPWRVESGRLVARLGRIVGRVTRGGAPVPRQRVIAKRAPHGTPYDATSDATGAFTLDELPFGTYEVSFDRGSSSPVVANVLSGEPVHVDLSQAGEQQ